MEAIIRVKHLRFLKVPDFHICSIFSYLTFLNESLQNEHPGRDRQQHHLQGCKNTNIISGDSKRGRSNLNICSLLPCRITCSREMSVSALWLIRFSNVEHQNHLLHVSHRHSLYRDTHHNDLNHDRRNNFSLTNMRQITISLNVDQFGSL